MAATEANHDSGTEAPTINGHALDSLEGVRQAFSYLNDEYNDGDIYELSTLHDNDAIAIESRHSSFQHMNDLMEAQCGGFIRIGPITAQHDRTLKIEVYDE